MTRDPDPRLSTAPTLADLEEVAMRAYATLPEELARAVERAIGIARRLAPRGGGPSGTPSRADGRVFTIASATGGCGKTFFSTNLAVFGKRLVFVFNLIVCHRENSEEFRNSG